MDNFNEKLAEINEEKLREYIFLLKSPCFESQLLKAAFPDFHIWKSDYLALYQHHFALFHVLYKMQEFFYKSDKYLHIHFMRTSLCDLPKKGNCRYFQEENGIFCSAGCEGNYCDFHLNLIGGEKQIDFLSVKHYYLDKKNYYNFDANSAELIAKGAWDILLNYGAYKKSFEILDIPETSDLRFIKRKFRTLALKYHPDHGEKSAEKFNEINRAYNILLRIIPLMQ
ncbi:MAG: DnaJ domain-containing protein [Desulfobacterales bacterium]|nr:DnaJ domain-containing protein [Desulfobacterales bacterium]